VCEGGGTWFLAAWRQGHQNTLLFKKAQSSRESARRPAHQSSGAAAQRHRRHCGPQTPRVGDPRQLYEARSDVEFGLPRGGLAPTPIGSVATRTDPIPRYCCSFVVVDSLVTDFSDPSGLDLTSTLRELLLDSVEEVGGAAACAGAAGAAWVAAGGACWQPVSVRPSAVKAKTARSLQE
jgi:hypothetical protein